MRLTIIDNCIMQNGKKIQFGEEVKSIHIGDTLPTVRIKTPVIFRIKMKKGWLKKRARSSVG